MKCYYFLGRIAALVATLAFSACSTVDEPVTTSTTTTEETVTHPVPATSTQTTTTRTIE